MRFRAGEGRRSGTGILRVILTGLVSTFLLLQAAPVPAKLYVDVNAPTVAKMPVAVPDFIAKGPTSLQGSDLARIVRHNLHLTGLFHLVDAPIPFPPAAGGEPDFEAWSRTGAQALIEASFQENGNEIILEARLYDVALRKSEIGKRYTGLLKDHRRIVHQFCDRVLEHLTGTLGCFSTRIAFVADSPPKELHAMDFDGHDLRQITRTGNIVMSPGWSPDARSLLYTGYARANPDLWSIDLSNLALRLVSSRSGINASGRYSPRGDLIALAMSFQGTPKIFLITPHGDIVKSLTTGRGNDISPSWSPDGSTIAFVSDQAGAPNVYSIPVNGGTATRLTFSTSYNTEPDWSPRGDLITFTSRIDGRFQVCTMRPDGSDVRVLTRTGSNEDPAWSPDGRMIAFSSNRTGRRLIYIMNATGEIQVPVSPIPGRSPAWSPRMGK